MNSARVRRAVRMVEQLELEPGEMRELVDELAHRPACVVDWDKVPPEDRELVALVERRLNNPTGPMVSMAEANRTVRKRLAELRTSRQRQRRGR